MNENTVIQVEGLSKRYRLGNFRGATLADDLKVTWARWTGKPNPLAPIDAKDAPRASGSEFWALRDISFSLDKGEVLGVIGKNGSGKSTLLKMLSRISLPTTGTIRMKGRVSSLLEVGTGFNPELSGRENIYLNGAILGMRRAEIDRKLDEIIAFSGIPHHIDSPVKRYSSGMKVRLGFAVAAHLEPEILIIDEVLAVGDAEFQRKCMGKIRDFAGDGRTILFVSHNMAAVKTLCSRVIWLEDGRVRDEGATDRIVAEYVSAYIQLVDRREWSMEEAPGDENVKVLKVALERETAELTWKNPFRLSIAVNNISVPADELSIGIQLFNEEDIMVFGSSNRENERIRIDAGTTELHAHVPGNLLNVGDYKVTVNVFRSGRRLFSVDEAIAFHVQDTERTTAWFGRSKGVVRPVLHWSASRGGSLID